MTQEQIYTLPLTTLTESNQNIRLHYDDDEMAMLMVSMSKIGLLQPIGVVRDKETDEEKYMIVWGHRRFRAAQKLGWEVIDCRLTEAKSELDFVIKNLNENLHRASVSLPEQGRQFAILMKKYDMTASQVAARMNCTKHHVELAVRAFQRIPARVRDKVSHGSRGQTEKKGTIPITSAMRVEQITRNLKLNRDTADKLYKAAAADDMSHQHIIVAARLMQQGRPPEDAIEEALSQRMITVMVTMNKDHILQLEKKHKAPIHELLYSWLEQNDEFQIESRGQKHLEKNIILKKKKVTDV